MINKYKFFFRYVNKPFRLMEIQCESSNMTDALKWFNDCFQEPTFIERIEVENLE